MGFTDDFDQLVFALVFSGAVVVAISKHLDACFHPFSAYLPVGDADTDEDVVVGESTRLMDAPTVLEMIIFIIGWGLVIWATHQARYLVDQASNLSDSSLAAWSLTGVYATPFFEILPAALGGPYKSTTCMIPKMVILILYFASWTVLSTFAAHEKPSPYKYFGYISGPLVALSAVIMMYTRYRTSVSKVLARIFTIMPYLCGWMFFALALSHRAG